MDSYSTHLHSPETEKLCVWNSTHDFFVPFFISFQNKGSRSGGDKLPWVYWNDLLEHFWDGGGAWFAMRM